MTQAWPHSRQVWPLRNPQCGCVSAADCRLNDVEIFAVTGSQGKTCVSHLIAQALGPQMRCACIGSVGVGFPGDLKTGVTAVAGGESLRPCLEALCRRGARGVAMRLSLDEFDGCAVAPMPLHNLIITGLADSGPVRDGQATRWLDALSGCLHRPELERVLVNLEDPLAPALLKAVPPNVKVCGYRLGTSASGRDSDCDLLVSAHEVELRPRGARMRVVSLHAGERSEVRFEAALFGACAVANLLAVLTLLIARGLPLKTAARELSGVRGVPGRMEGFGGDRTPLVVVDRVRTPAALEWSLGELRRHRPKRLLTVVGCAGSTDRAARQRMGAVAEGLSDALILTDDDLNGEASEAIIADMLDGVRDPRRVRVTPERGLAIRTAIVLAGRDDTVLVAGKGHETQRDLGEVQTWFSDRAQVLEALREWREGHH